MRRCLRSQPPRCRARRRHFASRAHTGRLSFGHRLRYHYTLRRFRVDVRGAQPWHLASWARRPGSCFSRERRSERSARPVVPRSRRFRLRASRGVFIGASVAHLHCDLVRNEPHFRRRSSNAGLFRHAGRLDRSSRRLYRWTRAVSAVRSPVPRPADEPESLRRTRAPWRLDRIRAVAASDAVADRVSELSAREAARALRHWGEQ